MVGSMIVDTLTLGPVTTSWVCLNCLLDIYGKSFMMDLVCLPLNKPGVILGMIWLEFNHVPKNCLDKTISFQEFDASDDLFISAKQVDESMKGDAEVFRILTSMKVDSKDSTCELPVVCEFLEVFPDDISDLSREHKVEFAIDLVLGTSPVSVDPYRISTSKLSDWRSNWNNCLRRSLFDRVFHHGECRCYW
ncbi:uncharacterized protein LOC127094041 [Lathyrus oleraceus]|uniref:uncharacterized protein LOC127094041 n=1 Tax=Pisum sativum TaxID=3888 RepID=UPI0021D3086B|nr:uncharacterized protein LOC127094041 [Pisum sativum]